MLNLITNNKLEINGKRLWETLDASAAIGKGKNGGLSRLCLTDDDKAMRDLFVRWCEESGCEVSIDTVGNIFARRDGLDNTLEPVMIGSHLDTQIAGGKYDGILGVLSGLEVIRTLNDRGIETKRPIEIVSWTNEEGVRFQPPMMGAGAYAGLHKQDWVLSQKDEDGITFGSELERIGYKGESIKNERLPAAYFELHIEQGPILDAEGVHVGIVTGGYTSFGAHVKVTGENAHSGPTPMRDRKNALVGASIIINQLNDIGWKYEPKGRAGCSRIDVSPNKYGILPDLAELTIDLRHPDSQIAEQMYEQMKDALPSIAKKANVEVGITKEWQFGNINFDNDLVNLVRSVSAELKVPHKHLLSAAGHDAYHLSSVVPTAMIFTPCKNGVTHNESEHIEPSYTIPGVNVLLHSVIHRADF